MKKISAKSKRGRYFVEAYNRSTNYTLEDVYATSSDEKQTAFRYCQQICEAENGRRLKVISATRWLFTVAFEVTTALGATELHVITKCHDYLVHFGDKL